MTATLTPPAVKAVDPFLAQFARVEAATGAQPAWLPTLRKTGLARFSELGFPTTHDEDWRFTSLAGLTKLPLQPLWNNSASGVTAETLQQFAFAKLPGSRLVFLNGRFVPQMSSVGALPPGVKVTNLAAALASDTALVEKYLGRYVQLQDNALAALNTAYFLDGGFIYVPAKQAVTEPIQLVYLTTTTDAGATVQPRNLIVVEAGAQVTVVESYVSLANASYFTNAVTELIVGDNATVEHVKLQDEHPEAFHLATIHGHLGRTTNVNVHSIALGSRLSRNTIRTKLAGAGLECILNGLYLTKDEQVADHHMVVEHAEPNCASHEYFNGILDGKSKGVFHGRILVQQAAQKTDAKQTNKSILLSDDATTDTKPQLEIYADDVKCTHGATVGQINEESVFYLRARGIGREMAKRMLIHAFAGEIIDRVKSEAVREELDQVVWHRLEALPHLASL